MIKCRGRYRTFTTTNMELPVTKDELNDEAFKALLYIDFLQIYYDFLQFLIVQF